MTIKTLLLGGALSALASGALAAPVTIGFDDAFSGTVVGATYAGLGVTFNDAIISNVLATSSPNAISSVSQGYNPTQVNPISAVFSSAVSIVSLTGLDVGADGFILKAFDAAVGGALVDFATAFGTGPGIGENFTLTVTGTNIFRVEFSQENQLLGDGDGMVFDDFVFDNVPAVPLPASLPLLLAGAAALGAFGRRRKA